MTNRIGVQRNHQVKSPFDGRENEGEVTGGGELPRDFGQGCTRGARGVSRAETGRASRWEYG